jgi:hypothetical protein
MRKRIKKEGKVKNMREGLRNEKGRGSRKRRRSEGHGGG